MKALTILPGLICALALSACATQPRTEGERQGDMAQQRADAAQGVADAYARSNKEQKQAREELARAQKDSERRSRQASDEATRVVDARERALDAPAQGERKIALAEAEARHTTAVQRCNEMRDNAVQNRCAIDADAALEQARREAAPPSPAN